MARAWLAVSVSESSIFLTLVFVASSLPEIIFVMTAGRLSDRYQEQRHRILGFSYWMRAPAAFAMGLLALRVDRWTVFDKVAMLLCVAMLAVGRSFAHPASKSLVVQLVRESELEWALGLLATNYRASQAIGPALGGFIVSALGMPMMFFLDALTFAFSGGICATIRPVGVGPSVGQGFDRGVIEYIRQQRSVRWLMVFMVYYGAVLTPMYIPFTALVKRDLKLDAAALGLFLTAFAGGFTVGALLLMRWIRSVPHRRRVLAGALGAGAFLIGASRTENPWAIGACLALAGAGHAVATITLDAWLQRVVHDDIRGRVQSVLGIMLVVCSPLTYLIAGSLVELLGAVTVIAVLGFAAMSVGVAVFAVPGISIEKDDSQVEPARVAAET